MGAVKHSRQRDAIKTFLMSRKDHPTADVVYTFVKNDFPSISLGTVYRNLSFLVEHGEAVTVPCEDGLFITMPIRSHICIFSAEGVNV
ncbi:MAG: transcriptional repressor [Lachnospira eligens]